MPTLTIDVTTPVATRVQTAYGAGSLAELKAMIIADIKKKVVDFEKKQAEATAKAALETAETTYQSAIATAESTAESEIQLT